ncbi:MAG TPA: sulfotransferase [Caulobacteraceae bacterium]|nr:sulfotransferase [Caulobacteraceae bacterium]
MEHGFHLISGLPRSGSTLLSALLRQNPKFHASMTSPMLALMNAMLRHMSQENEGAVFIDDDQRTRILRGVVDNFYADISPGQTIFDTNRGWTTKLWLLAKLFPQTKVICCVRNPAWVLDSLERLTRRNALEPSGIFKYDPVGTVYTRAEGLMGANGMVGYAIAALREGVFDEHRGRLMLVRYETLVGDPKATLAKIYEFVGAEPFEHDPDNIEEDYMSLEFDARLGAPGLHSVGGRVRRTTRPTLLPPDLFQKYAKDDFWERKADYPEDLKVI